MAIPILALELILGTLFFFGSLFSGPLGLGTGEDFLFFRWFDWERGGVFRASLILLLGFLVGALPFLFAYSPFSRIRNSWESGANKLEQKLEKAVSLQFLAVVSFAILAVQIGLAGYGFFSNYDFTDAGYNYYLHLFGPDATVTGVAMHFITHPLGFLFGHLFLGFRFLTLAGILGGTGFLVYALKRYLYPTEHWDRYKWLLMYSLAASAANGFFVFTPTLDYNFFCILAYMGWAGAFMLYGEKGDKPDYWRNIHCVSAAFFLGMTILSKFTFGLLLLGVTPMVLLWFRYHDQRPLFKSAIILIAALIAQVIWYGYYSPEYWARFWDNLQWVNNSSVYAGSSKFGGIFTIFEQYSLQILYFLRLKAAWVLFILASFYFLPKALSREKLNWQPAYHAILTATTLGALVLLSIVGPLEELGAVHETGFHTLQYLFAGLMWGVIFLGIKTYKTFSSPHFWFAMVLLVFGLSHFMGTTAGIMIRMPLALGLLGMVFYLLYYRDSQGFAQKKLILFMIMLAVGVAVNVIIWKEQISLYRRNGPAAIQTTYSQFSPYLKGIRLESAYAQSIDALWLRLKDYNFDFKVDRIFSYGDNPGYLAAIGAQAFGESWAPLSFANSVDRACWHLEFEPIGRVQRVFVLKFEDDSMAPEIQKCLNAKLKPLPELAEHDLGQVPLYYRHRIDYPPNRPVRADLHLIGPYALK